MSPRRRRSRPASRSAAPRKAKRPASGRESLEYLPRRLKHLYEIIKLFASFETVEETFDAALAVATETLPLRSAILIEVERGQAMMTLWPSGSESTEEMLFAKKHARTALTYLMGSDSSLDPGSTERAGRSSLPSQPLIDRKAAKDRQFVVIPLVSAHRPIFGALQLETTGTLDKTDVVFANTIANQLAVALDRDRHWRGDIEARRQAERLSRENLRLLEEARQAISGREQILAIVSHDLRNPLNTIVLATGSLVRRSETLDKATVTAAEKIRRASDRMQRLIEDLLDFASIEAGRLGIDRKPRDPASILKEACASFDAAAQAAGIQLSTEIAEDLPMVYCDRQRILQVLGNIIANALELVPKGGKIALRAATEREQLVLSIVDTGPGISAADQEHLFERYWRSGAAAYKGSGLGLAIAKGIVKAHGGRLWVESELGRGATFLVSLPLATPADQGASAVDSVD